MPPTAPVVVVGAGIAGVSCARTLHDAGVAVRVLDRGRRPGGRMAVRTVEGRPVDTGASYFTVRGPDLTAVVDDWVARGLAHGWTDTFATAGPDGLTGRKAGPLRYGAAGGLRSLVEDLATGLDLRSGVDVGVVGPGPVVDGEPAAAVVLAMPDPQALDLLDPALAVERAALDGREWDPVLALYGAWPERTWQDFDGAFVAGSDTLEWIADDGARRGDGAPVLVAHSTPALAAAHLDDPAAATDVLVAAVRRVLGVGEPEWVRVQRWSLAKPVGEREPLFHLGDALVGLCGDGWGAARVETAFRSGRELATALLARL